MKIKLIAVGQRMSAWVTAGYQEYAKRLTADYQLELIEIPTKKRLKHTHIEQLKQYEADLIKAKLSAHTLNIALDVTGKSLNTAQLAQQFAKWQQQAQDISLIIGGPEGLAPSLLAEADLRWSLSALTFPHPLVRIILAEQIYRAWSINHNHPYHRA
ncbi:MAG: 23S rRNA (pseudouridine(1915)-N(3))-methyltransferase RlmH [Gammaproteobacteria bacterium]